MRIFIFLLCCFAYSQAQTVSSATSTDIEESSGPTKISSLTFLFNEENQTKVMTVNISYDPLIFLLPEKSLNGSLNEIMNQMIAVASMHSLENNCYSFWKNGIIPISNKETNGPLLASTYAHFKSFQRINSNNVIFNCTTKTLNIQFFFTPDCSDVGKTGTIPVLGHCPKIPAYNETLKSSISIIYSFVEKNIEKQFFANQEIGCIYQKYKKDIFVPLNSLTYYNTTTSRTDILNATNTNLLNCANNVLSVNYEDNDDIYYKNGKCINVTNGNEEKTTLSMTGSCNLIINSSDICFPSKAMVKLENGMSIPMHDLKIGDRIYTINNQTSPVYFFTHQDMNVESTFIEFVFAENKTIRLSPNHYIFVADANKPEDFYPVSALDVQFNQYLNYLGQSVPILEKNLVRDIGLFNPHTLDGNLLVNDILVSSYTNSIPLPMAHVLLAPLRALYLLENKN